MRGMEHGYIERPHKSMDMWGNSGMSMASVYGPAAGQSTAERASHTPPSMMGVQYTDPTKVLSVPALVLLGVLAWYAIKAYE